MTRKISVADEAIGAEELIWDPARGEYVAVDRLQRLYEAAARTGMMRTFENEERARIALLNKPPAPNPPELLALVRCEARRPFFLAGKEVKVGEMVKLPRHDAQSLAALGRVRVIE